MGERTLRSEFAVALKPKLKRERLKKARSARRLIPNGDHRWKDRISRPYLGKVFTRRIVDRSIGRV